MNRLTRLIVALFLVAGASIPALGWNIHGVLSVPAVQVYLSSSTGNDTNPCSQASPCATLAKAMTFQYGDGSTLNLFNGDTFNESAPTLKFYGPVSLQPTNTFGSLAIQTYGGGTCNVIAQTISGCATIQFTGTNTMGIYLENTNSLAVQNLRIVGGTASALAFDAAVGILYENHNARQNYGLTVQNVEMLDISYGFHLRTLSGQINNIDIEDNFPHGSTPATTIDFGMRIEGGYIGLVQGNLTQNIGSRNAASSDPSSGSGIIISLATAFVDQFNVTATNGQNSTTCGGPYGNWTFEAANVLLQFNESYGEGPSTIHAGACDEGGFDIDGGSSFVTVQFNYAHGNNGPGVLMFQAASGGFPWTSNTVRYNVIEEVTGSRAQVGDGFEFTGASKTNTGSAVYNNTYATDSNSPSEKFGTCFYYQADTDAIIANNICYNAGSTGGKFAWWNFSGQPSHWKAAGNNFFRVNNNNSGSAAYNANGTTFNTLAGYRAKAGTEQGSITTDPGISSPLNGGTCYPGGGLIPSGPQPCPAAYALGGGSTDIGNGIDLTKPPYALNVGTRDFYGFSIPHTAGTGFNIGAFGGPPSLCGNSLDFSDQCNTVWLANGVISP